MQSLFRPEAVAHATGRLDGAVLLPAPLATWGVIAIVAASLGLGAWFAATATYTRHESVPGWLSPQSRIARDVTGEFGPVTTRHVADDELIAELLVPPRAAGVVEPGQSVPLKYALPIGHRGVQHGTVTHVSRTALAPDEIGDHGIPVSGPVFLVRVRLPAQRVDTGGASVRLRAGMLLTAEIAGHRRTFLESLFGSDVGKP